MYHICSYHLSVKDLTGRDQSVRRDESNRRNNGGSQMCSGRKSPNSISTGAKVYFECATSKTSLSRGEDEPQVRRVPAHSFQFLARCQTSSPEPTQPTEALFRVPALPPVTNPQRGRAVSDRGAVAKRFDCVRGGPQGPQIIMPGKKPLTFVFPKRVASFSEKRGSSRNSVQ